MPKRPVAEALARATAPLEALPEFPMPAHAPLCNIANGEDCDCGIADARPIRSNGVDMCGATSPWLSHCTSEVEHNGSHSWQDQDRFPAASKPTTVIAGDLGDGVLVPLKDAEEVWAATPAIREVNGKWTAIELAEMPSKQPKGNAPMTSTATVVTMTATLKRLGYKSGTQADPDAYVEMVIRTNDLSVGAELGWQTGKTLSVTMQPEQPRLTGVDSEAES